MTCRHPLGVWADNDGNVLYKFDDTDQLYPNYIFKFCPECGVNLLCEHIFECMQETYDPRTMTYESRCIKCGFVPNQVKNLLC